MDWLSITRAISYLLMPLPLALGLSLVGAILICRRRSRIGLVCLLTGGFILWLSATPWVAATMARALESEYPPKRSENCTRVDAIVVLGGAVRAPLEGDPLPRMLRSSDRVWEAARLYRAGCAPIVFVAAGGDVEATETAGEATAISTLLHDLGVPESALRIDQRSRNTKENAREAWRGLSATGARRILLVTSAWHMRRAEREFVRVGFKVYPVAADYRSLDLVLGPRAWMPDAEALALSHLAVKEYLGWAYGSLLGSRD